MNKYILFTNTKEIHGESIDNDKIFNHEIGSFLESYEMNADVYDEFDNLESALDVFNEINADCGVFLSHTRVSYITAAFIHEVDENGDFENLYSAEKPDRFILKMYPVCFHATLLMKKECYDAIDGYISSPRTLRCEDIDMWFRFTAAGFKAYNLQECLYKVREDRKALKRRKLRFTICNVKTNLYGFRLLDYPIYLYPYALKPIVSHFIPYRLKSFIRQLLHKA